MYYALFIDKRATIECGISFQEWVKGNGHPLGGRFLYLLVNNWYH